MTPKQRFIWARRAWAAVFAGAALLVVICICAGLRYVIELITK